MNVLVAGMAAKLYDDMCDNPFLAHWATPFRMEFLKLTHTVLFTTSCVQHPTLLVLLLCNCLVGKQWLDPTAYENPYEHALMYAGAVIATQCSWTFASLFSWFDLVFVLGFCVSFALENILFSQVEVSLLKGLLRGGGIIYLWCVSRFLTNPGLIALCSYVVGYLFVSSAVQGYSACKKKKKRSSLVKRGCIDGRKHG